MIFFFISLIFFLLGWTMPYLTSSFGIKRWKKEAELLFEKALLERQKLAHETDKELSEKKSLFSIQQEKFIAEQVKKEKAFLQKETLLKRKEEEIQAFANRLDEKRKKSDARNEELEHKEQSLEKELLRKAHITQEEALQLVLAKVQDFQRTLFHEQKNNFIKELIEDEKRKIDNAFEEALATSYNTLTSHSHVAIIKLSDSISFSRLIGKDGKNIEGLSALFECDLWVDDEKQELLISSYDDIKRFIAEKTFLDMFSKDILTLNQACLIKKNVEANLDKEFARKGLEAVQELSLFHTYRDPILATIGKLSLRSSHGQNVLLHSIEVAKTARIVAEHLGLSVDLAVQIGLFHDIGKVLSVSWGARHPERGRAFLNHYDLDKKVSDGVFLHHGNAGHTSYESMIIPYLDALSAKGCLKRLVQHTTPFKKIQQQIEQISSVTSAFCFDSQNKLLIFIRTKDQSLDIQEFEKILRKERINIPIEVQILPHISGFSAIQDQKTLIFLPENK